jgi:hypothetical protein
MCSCSDPTRHPFDHPWGIHIEGGVERPITEEEHWSAQRGRGRASRNIAARALGYASHEEYQAALEERRKSRPPRPPSPPPPPPKTYTLEDGTVVTEAGDGQWKTLNYPDGSQAHISNYGLSGHFIPAPSDEDA